MLKVLNRNRAAAISSHCPENSPKGTEWGRPSGSRNRLNWMGDTVMQEQKRKTATGKGQQKKKDLWVPKRRDPLVQEKGPHKKGFPHVIGQRKKGKRRRCPPKKKKIPFRKSVEGCKTSGKGEGTPPITQHKKPGAFCWMKKTRRRTRERAGKRYKRWPASPDYCGEVQFLTKRERGK